MRNFSVGGIYTLRVFASGLVPFCFVPKLTQSEQAASHSPNLWFPGNNPPLKRTGKFHYWLWFIELSRSHSKNLSNDMMQIQRGTWSPKKDHNATGRLTIFQAGIRKELLNGIAKSGSMPNSVPTLSVLLKFWVSSDVISAVSTYNFMFTGFGQYHFDKPIILM